MSRQIFRRSSTGKRVNSAIVAAVVGERRLTSNRRLDLEKISEARKPGDGGSERKFLNQSRGSTRRVDVQCF
jgi:hypothetical protein